MQKVLLNKKHHKQELKASCVAASALMVLNYLGVNIKDESYLRKIIKTKPIGTNITNLLFLRDEKDFGVDVSLEFLSTDDVIAYLRDSKNPIIALVDTSFLSFHDIITSHTVVIVGFEEEKIIINDPWFDEKEIYTDIDEFKLAWGKFGNLVVKIFKRN